MTIYHIHPGMKADPDRKWASVPEMDLFSTLNEAGQVSIFRLGSCKVEGCKLDIPKSKDFCSKAHFDEYRKARSAALVKDIFEDLEGRWAERRAKLEAEAAAENEDDDDAWGDDDDVWGDEDS